jgi:cellulose synthase/poly-beta-1,6-N-acetylglucosamine synthase-like glycosyltransferase
LDDSTDQTTAIARRQAALWRARGINVRVLHRTDRRGYKAGALANAFPYARGEFIAIFDADFVPTADFLQQTVPRFLHPQNADIGFVQARWGHLNAGYSALTRCQALALDGHFVVEQSARQSAGYPFGFNGSAGVWRRACIEDARVGGWQTDTLCEDLDLSYRAQLAGWRPLYLNDLEVPAEIPPQLLAFKRQQFRWAKGSVQTLKKLGRAVWSSRWSTPARLAAILHLGNYLIHPLLRLAAPLVLPTAVDSLRYRTLFEQQYRCVAGVAQSLDAVFAYTEIPDQNHPGPLAP